jgi:DNA polymerase-3 subunit delta'
VEQGLQARWGLEAGEARTLAHLSAGRPGYALRLHQEPERLEQIRAWLEDHRRLLGSNLVERFAYVEALAREKDALRGALQVWAGLWRDVLLRAAGSEAAPVNLEQREQIEALAARFPLFQARRIIASLERTQDLVDRNVNARLACEVLMMDLPQAA